MTHDLVEAGRDQSPCFFILLIDEAADGDVEALQLVMATFHVAKPAHGDDDDERQASELKGGVDDHDHAEVIQRYWHGAKSNAPSESQAMSTIPDTRQG